MLKAIFFYFSVGQSDTLKQIQDDSIISVWDITIIGRVLSHCIIHHNIKSCYHIPSTRYSYYIVDEFSPHSLPHSILQVIKKSIILPYDDGKKYHQRPYIFLVWSHEIPVWISHEISMKQFRRKISDSIDILICWSSLSISHSIIVPLSIPLESPLWWRNRWTHLLMIPCYHSVIICPYISIEIPYQIPLLSH